MKNSILTFALTALFALFTLSSIAMQDVTSTAIECVEGGHKCDDNCKKDKDGKCAEVKKQKKKQKKGKTESCAKEGKSCSSKCAGSKEKAKSDTDPKS